MKRVTFYFTDSQWKAVSQAIAIRSSGLFPPIVPPQLDDDGKTDEDATTIAEICRSFHAELKPANVSDAWNRSAMFPPSPPPTELFPPEKPQSDGVLVETKEGLVKLVDKSAEANPEPKRLRKTSEDGK